MLTADSYAEVCLLREAVHVLVALRRDDDSDASCKAQRRRAAMIRKCCMLMRLGEVHKASKCLSKDDVRGVDLLAFLSSGRMPFDGRRFGRVLQK